ncbi:MAG TPA: hypothetical protein VN581_03790 [Patescibacteria group bacterium]|nr:hypothetical protein [Patescibacteria group bacterium]
MRRLSCIAMLLGSIVATGCAAPGTAATTVSEPPTSVHAHAEPTVPSLQADKIAMLSNAFAAKRIGAFHYQVTRLGYEVLPGSRVWTIHYELGQAPDGRRPDPVRFDVLIDDRDGEVTYADVWP